MSNNNKKSAALLLRVSTKKQSTARQEADLRAIAEARNYAVKYVINETISGAAKVENRTGLKQLMELAEAGEIDLVAVTEISRLGRSTALVLSCVEKLHELGVGIYVQQFELWSMKQNGEKNPMSGFFLQMLAAFAELERNTIQERVKSGIANYIESGGKMGRPLGKEPNEVFLNRNKEVKKWVMRGFSYQEVKNQTGRSLSVINKVAQLLTDKEKKALKKAKFEHKHQEALKKLRTGGVHSDLRRMGISNGTTNRIVKFFKENG